MLFNLILDHIYGQILTIFVLHMKRLQSIKTFNIYLSVLLLILSFCSLSAFSLNFEKTVTENYSQGLTQQIRIVNHHGNIIVKQSETDSISIDFKLEVELDTKDDSMFFFSSVRPVISKSRTSLTAELYIDPDMTSNYNYVSTVIINAPDSLNWNLTNKFGDIITDASMNIVVLNLDYGKTYIPSVLCPEKKISSINLFQATIKADTIINAIISSTNSIADIGFIHSAVVKSDFSTYQIGACNMLDFTTETDIIDIRQASNINIKGIYSEVSLQHLFNTCESELTYGKFQLYKIHSGFRAVNINHKNVATSIFYDPQASFIFNGDLKYCDLILDQGVKEGLRIIEDIAEKDISGTIGSPETTSTVTIVSRYEDVSLKSSNK